MKKDAIDLETRREFGNAAEICRTINGLSIRSIAMFSGIGNKTVVRIENGGNVRIKNIQKYASALEHLPFPLYFDFDSGSVIPSTPEQKTAILVAEWRCDKVQKIRYEEDFISSDRKDRTLDAWKAMRDICDDILNSIGVSNFPRANKIVNRYSVSLGQSFDDINVIALGVHGERLISLANLYDTPFLEDTAEDLKALARAHGPFILQFPTWRSYLEDSFLEPKQEIVKLTSDAAYELAKINPVISDEVSVSLQEIADDSQEKEKNEFSSREVVFAVRNVMSALLGPVARGSGAGLEILSKYSVLAGGGVLATLAINYGAQFGWLRPWIEKVGELLE